MPTPSNGAGRPIFTPGETEKMTHSDLEHRARMAQLWGDSMGRDSVARAALAWAKEVLGK